jgi:hypothetical protein
MSAADVWNPDLPKTPVVFLVFNRPDLTARVFETIRAARPDKLLIVADGPRPNRLSDDALCTETRRIVSAVDWPCDVRTNFAPSNMGCRDRVASGIDWAFSLVEEAIILEDDCLPEMSFFRFCQELLDRYRDEPTVMHISGANLHTRALPAEHDYYFSRHTHIWGWATWRRAWRHYDLQMSSWGLFKGVDQFFNEPLRPAFRRYFCSRFDLTYAGRLDTWDYQWTLTCWRNKGLSITPTCNLISNIGFDERAAHTRSHSHLAAMPTYASRFPLEHPAAIERSVAADNLLETHQFNDTPWDRLRAIIDLALHLGVQAVSGSNA